MARDYTGKKKEKIKKHFSFTFLLAIPGNFLIGALCLTTFLTLFQEYIFEKQIWASFAAGLIGSAMVVGTSDMPRLRTLIHELRHAVVVVLTGNLLKSIEVKKHSGHVNYEMYEDTLHFAPIIALAPYFFPLFSLPALAACLVFEDYDKTLLAFLLGVTLAADLVTAYGELHPHQSDLKKIVGGFFSSGLYLAGAHFMWCSVCLIWIQGGRNAYLYVGNVFLELIALLAPFVQELLK